MIFDDNISFANVNSTDDVPSIDEMLEVMRTFKAIDVERRKKRDQDFLEMRCRGYSIWAWDEGPLGETWVLGDFEYGQIRGQCKAAERPTVIPAHVNIEGVPIMRLSDALAAGFNFS